MLKNVTVFKLSYVCIEILAFVKNEYKISTKFHKFHLPDLEKNELIK